MEYYNNTLAVEASWLFDEQIISFSNYKQLSARGNINILRRGCLNTPALVSYESLPTRFKEAVIVKLGNKNPYSVVKTNLVESYIQHSARLSEFFETYKLSDGRNLPKATRKEYYANAIVLEAIGAMLENKNRLRSSMGKRLKINWSELAEGVQELDRSKYPHTLPATDRRLEGRYKRYKSEGEISLIHKNFQNNHAASVNDDKKKSLIIKLLRHKNNIPDTIIAEEYNLMAGVMGWRKITAAAVGVWRKKLALEIHDGRYGLVSAANNVKMQMKRSRPTMPMLYWTMDGWDVELLYQGYDNGRDTFHNRHTVVVVLDPCCDYIMGYAIGDYENPTLVADALRDASEHTLELFGTRLRPHQLQSDRYAISKMMPIYDAMAKYVTPAQAKNSKSKVIEPWFKHKMNEICRLEPNWNGHNVTAKKKNQPNLSDRKRSELKRFPDKQGNIRQLEEKIAILRDEKIDEFMSLWATVPEDKKLPMTRENYLHYFGKVRYNRQKEIITNKFCGQGIIAAIEGKNRTYDSFELNFRKNMGVDWIIKHDPNDLTTVLATNKDGTLQFLLEEKYIQPMALAERTDGDSDQLQRVRNFNKELASHISNVAISADNTFYEFMRENTEVLTPEIKNDTLYKHLITDSTGQHKNNRNHARMLKQAEKLNSQYEDAVLVEDVSDFKEGRIDYLRNKVDLSIY